MMKLKVKPDICFAKYLRSVPQKAKEDAGTLDIFLRKRLGDSHRLGKMDEPVV
jgi:hypothetical protein